MAGSRRPMGAGGGCRSGVPGLRPSSRSPGTRSLPWRRTSPTSGSFRWALTVSAEPPKPRLITALAGPDGWIDSLDMLMAGRGTGCAGEPPRLVGRPDLVTHPRAAFAASIRDQVRPMGYADRSRSALALISRGIAGLTELSFELEPQRRGQGGGAELVRGALTAIPAGQLVMAAVAPGNAASVRALLAAGFVPLGSLQLFRRAAGPLACPADGAPP